MRVAASDASAVGAGEEFGQTIDSWRTKLGSSVVCRADWVVEEPSRADSC